MKNSLIAGALAAVLVGLVLSQPAAPSKSPAPKPVPAPAPVPTPPKPPKPKRPCPCELPAVAGANTAVAVRTVRTERTIEAKVGGRVAPDGVTGIDCDLPDPLHCKNCGGSDGAGLCVFTSIMHSARYQDVPQLADFQAWMKRHPGGGYPSKVDKMIAQKCKEQNIPVPPYLQIEAKGDEVMSVLRLASKSGRMPAVTYSKSPTGRYGGGTIAHMVSMPHCDEKSVAILDNNYIGTTAYEWMTPDEFLKVCNKGGTVWAVILLEPGPPPPPTQAKETDSVKPFFATAALAAMLGLTAVDANADCPSCSMGRGFAAAPAPRMMVPAPRGKGLTDGWSAYDAANTWHYWYSRGELLGAWNQETREWFPHVRGSWLPASTAPWIGAEQIGVEANYGMQREPGAEKAPVKYRLNGKPVNREEAESALRDGAKSPLAKQQTKPTRFSKPRSEAPEKPDLPDDSQRMRLTVIGPEAERNQVLNDVATNPVLAGVRDKVVAKGYDPANWAVKDYGFVTSGKPTIYLQNPDGTVVFRRDQYDGAADLAERCMRNPDPLYDPSKDGDGSVLSLPGGLGGVIPLLPPAIVFAGLLLFPRAAAAKS